MYFDASNFFYFEVICENNLPQIDTQLLSNFMKCFIFYLQIKLFLNLQLQGFILVF